MHGEKQWKYRSVKFTMNWKKCVDVNFDVSNIEGYIRDSRDETRNRYRRLQQVELHVESARSLGD